MMRRFQAAAVGSLVVALSAVPLANAAPAWQSLIPFKRVEADPNKDYFLTEDDGPWLIMCRAFAGESAQQEAHALVLELRQRFKLKAYVHQKDYDFTKKEIGKGFDMHGSPKVMKPANPSQFVEVAVLVGDFDGPEDPNVDGTLAAIKKAFPNCLDVKNGKGQSQRYWGIREVVQRKEKDGKGPMRMAFLTRNPMLPDEYFAPKGLDPIVKQMNKDHKYSLLRNPSNFSVRIATFRGNSTTTIKTKEIEALEREEIRRSKLEEGAVKAEKLCEALRQEGEEAYVFHDIHESIVTIGSFDSVGEPRGDGKIEINPAVHRVIESYKAKTSQRPGEVANLGPVKKHGVTLDVQPLPVAVPRESIGAQFVRRPQ
jgi:hypothetical protein